MSEETYIFKVVVGGAGGVGKTTLLHRYLHGKFLPGSAMTIGVEFHSKDIYLNQLQKKIKLALWDLGGQQRFRFLQSGYSAGAKAGIVFFDMTRIDTMDQVKDWVNMFRKHASPGLPILLGGTKLDLVDADVIEQVNHYARETAANLCMPAYIATSSKTGQGVNEIFTYIVDTLVVQSQDAKERS
ncbi:MAG: Rab family GTPase [Candidatus Sigynarchaeota archaeon]